MTENGSDNGSIFCNVADCTRTVHGHGLCAAHLQEWKRSGERPDESGREDAMLAGALALGTGAADFTEAELRAGWERLGAKLIEQSPPGRRPLAFWAFEAGRPEHLTPRPKLGAGALYFGDPAGAEALEDWEAEPVEFLAAEGHLTAEELAVIRGRASEAAARLGTAAERRTGNYSRDRAAVGLAERVESRL